MTGSRSALTAVLSTALSSFALAACAGGGANDTSSSVPAANGPPPNVAMNNARAADSSNVAADSDSLTRDTDDDDESRAILNQLGDEVTIGSTVDPQNGDQNPYGLAIAKADAAGIAIGDLVVCNFNNAANVQGTGSTVIALHPNPGSKPKRIAQNAALLGCTEIALAPSDTIWAAAFAANVNPILSPAGALLTTLPSTLWHGPFGEVFAPHLGPGGTVAAFYESNATDGSIVRINIKPGPTFTFDRIATGFAVNGGAPGSILGPSGLQYDARKDRLYVVDGANNTLVAFRHVSTIPAGGIIVKPNGTAFDGPFQHRARLIFAGAPLNGPISSALLPGQHLVLGNTLDPNGKNLMVEISSGGRVLAVKNVDTGAAAAIFGMVASGTSDDDVKLYFNDDNDNTTRLLKR